MSRKWSPTRVERPFYLIQALDDPRRPMMTSAAFARSKATALTAAHETSKDSNLKDVERRGRIGTKENGSNQGDEDDLNDNGTVHEAMLETLEIKNDDDDDDKCLLFKLLPNDLLFEVLKRISARDLVRLSTSCKKFEKIIDGRGTNDSIEANRLWEKISNEAFQFYDRTEQGTKRKCDLFYGGSYRRMFYERARVRSDGLYVSRNTYVKAAPRREIGSSKKDARGAAHVVVYYRYFRFFPSGEWYAKTSPEPVKVVKKTMLDCRRANEDSSVNVGFYKLDDKRRETRIHCQSTKMKSEAGYVTRTHFWLRLRSRIRAGSDRLDCVKLLLVDEDLHELENESESDRVEKEQRLKPSEQNWKDQDDYEALYRRSLAASRQGVAPGAYSSDNINNERDLQRGLNTLVFIPWSEIDAHELNKPIEEMDFYVTG